MHAKARGARQGWRAASFYAEVTGRIITELEAGRLPWACPWDDAACACTIPRNAATGRAYSGINVLILWAAVIDGGFSSQSWLTYRHAERAGGHVRKSEKGAWVCFADRCTPHDEEERASRDGRETRSIPFL